MNDKKFFSVLAVGAVLTAVLRFIQLFFLVDGKTGFVWEETAAAVGNIAVTVITLLCFLVVLIITTAFNKRQPIGAPKVSNHLPLVVTGFLMAGYFLVSSAVTAVSLGSASKIEYLKLALELLCTVFFVFFSVSGLSSDVKVPQALALAPIFYGGYELIFAYMDCRGVANISDNIYKLAFLSFMLLFYLFEGKLLANAECRKSARLMLPVASFCLIFGTICTLPPLFMSLIGKRSALHTTDLPIGYLIAAVFAISFCAAMYREAKTPSGIERSTQNANIGENTEPVIKTESQIESRIENKAEN